jgi:hypothetical protein
MRVHPFGDPRIEDEFGAERQAIDARESMTKRRGGPPRPASVPRCGL